MGISSSRPASTVQTSVQPMVPAAQADGCIPGGREFFERPIYLKEDQKEVIANCRIQRISPVATLGEDNQVYDVKIQTVNWECRTCDPATNKMVTLRGVANSTADAFFCTGVPVDPKTMSAGKSWQMYGEMVMRVQDALLLKNCDGSPKLEVNVDNAHTDKPLSEYERNIFIHRLATIAPYEIGRNFPYYVNLSAQSSEAQFVKTVVTTCIEKLNQYLGENPQAVRDYFSQENMLDINKNMAHAYVTDYAKRHELSKHERAQLHMRIDRVLEGNDPKYPKSELAKLDAYGVMNFVTYAVTCQ